MAIVYHLVTYDKHTERKCGEFAIPHADLGTVRQIAGILLIDDGLGDYPLNPDQANEIARLLNRKIDCKAFSYYVEPYDVPKAKNRA